MNVTRNLLARGNRKLGESIHAWSIPALDTCPGRTQLCEQVCYARHGHFGLSRIQERLQENLDASLRDDFERRMVAEIHRRGVHTLRVHVSGDFYDPGYVRKWVRIAEKCHRTKFYAYTRSWRLPEFQKVLQELAKLRNWRLWWSCDAETGIPDQFPERVELAYLQTEHGQDPGNSKVVFRLKRLRRHQVLRIGLALVCPTETGLPNPNGTCTSCRRCFK